MDALKLKYDCYEILCNAELDDYMDTNEYINRWYHLDKSQAETVYPCITGRNIYIDAWLECKDKDDKATLVGATVFYEEYPRGTVGVCTIALNVKIGNKETVLSPHRFFDTIAIDTLKMRSQRKDIHG